MTGRRIDLEAIATAPVVDDVMTAAERAAFVQRQAALATALHDAQVGSFYYSIEVVGACNLRCPSCAVGNTPAGGPAKGLMSVETFDAILDKIRREQSVQNRETVTLDLYNWGEPLLHPQLPTIVRHARAAGFKVGISTNLNQVKTLDEVIEAGVSYVRVSLSGYWQASYARMHRGGNIETVKQNLQHMRAAIDRVGAPTIVQIGYITYRHNAGEELDRMAALCHRLDFHLSRDPAALMPLEKLLAAIETSDVPADVGDLLPIAPRLRADLSRPYRDRVQDCALRRGRITINVDASVPLCCAVWSRDYDIAPSYLTTSEADIQAARYAHPLCARCQSNMADFIYNGIYVPPVSEHVQAVLGPAPAER